MIQLMSCIGQYWCLQFPVVQKKGHFVFDYFASVMFLFVSNDYIAGNLLDVPQNCSCNKQALDDHFLPQAVDILGANGVPCILHVTVAVHSNLQNGQGVDIDDMEQAVLAVNTVTQ